MKVSIVYDGKCPVCRNVVAATRLRERTHKLELIDARKHPIPLVQGQNVRHLDFNEGFAVVVNGEVFHADEGAHMLAMLSQPSGIAFRIFRFLVLTKKRSRFWYPLLKLGRRLLLKILRIPEISSEQEQQIPK